MGIHKTKKSMSPIGVKTQIKVMMPTSRVTITINKAVAKFSKLTKQASFTKKIKLFRIKITINTNTITTINLIEASIISGITTKIIITIIIITPRKKKSLLK